MSAALRVMLLTEDSGEDAHEVLRHVVERALRAAQDNLDMEQVEVLPRTQGSRQAMQFLSFRARKAHRARVDLARELVDRLTDDGAPTFILVHVDGDRTWAERVDPPTHVAEFREHILPGVRNGLAQLGVLERSEHLLFVVPHYSIEAWLYQNTPRLRALYAKAPADHPNLVDLDAWKHNPGALDEVPGPKDRLSIHDRHNLDLARTLPGGKLMAVGKSFTATVLHLRACEPLVRALRQATFV